MFFLECSLNSIKANGYIGLLTPNKWFRAKYGKMLRKFLRETTKIELIVDFGHSKNLFPEADTFPAIFVASRKQKKLPDNTSFPFVKAHDTDRERRVLKDLIKFEFTEVQYDNLLLNQWRFESREVSILLKRLLGTGVPLSLFLQKYCSSTLLTGIKSGFNTAFYIDSHSRDILVSEDPDCEPLIKKLFRGRDLLRWQCQWSDYWHITIPSSTNVSWPWSNSPSRTKAEEVFSTTYPSLYNHLLSYKPQLLNRSDKGTFWWELRSCDYYSQLENAKIIVQCIAYFSRFSLDLEGVLINNKVIAVPTDDVYLLSILNSRVTWWIMFKTFQHMKDDGISVDKQYLSKLPIPIVSESLRKDICLVGNHLINASSVAGENASLIYDLECQLNDLVEKAFDITYQEKDTLKQNLPPRDPIISASKCSFL